MMHTRERGGIFFKLMFLLSFLAFCGLIYLLRHPLLRLAGGFWVVEDALQKSDALIVLSDDNFYADRATRAAELYRAGWAPVIVASGRRLRAYAGIAELIDHDLIERGVPKEAIVRFPHTADNTREEAQALLAVTTTHRWRRVVIVTSNHHTRRARYIFRRVLGDSVEVRVAAARDQEYDASRWWETRRGIKLFFNEAVGMCAAWWELRGERKPPAGAQAVVGVGGVLLPDLV